MLFHRSAAMLVCHTASNPAGHPPNSRALSSAGQSIGLLIRRSQVRILQGAPSSPGRTPADLVFCIDRRAPPPAAGCHPMQPHPPLTGYTRDESSDVCPGQRHKNRGPRDDRDPPMVDRPHADSASAIRLFAISHRLSTHLTQTRSSTSTRRPALSWSEHAGRFHGRRSIQRGRGRRASEASSSAIASNS